MMYLKKKSEINILDNVYFKLLNFEIFEVYTCRISFGKHAKTLTTQTLGLRLRLLLRLSSNRLRIPFYVVTNA